MVALPNIDLKKPISTHTLGPLPLSYELQDSKGKTK